jgi:hypothetical protein
MSWRSLREAQFELSIRWLTVGARRASNLFADACNLTCDPLTLMKIFSIIRPALVIGLAATSSLAAPMSPENEIDFESMGPEMPGWSATMKLESGDSEYRQLAKWDAPMAFSISSENPHGGGACLKLEFSEGTQNMVSFAPPMMSVPASNVTIRFFVRTENIDGEGLFSFDESDENGTRIHGHWASKKIPQSDDWVEVSWTGTLDTQTPNVRMSFVYPKGAPANAKIWIDDLSVTENTDGTPATDSDTVEKVGADKGTTGKKGAEKKGGKEK